MRGHELAKINWMKIEEQNQQLADKTVEKLNSTRDKSEGKYMNRGEERNTPVTTDCPEAKGTGH